MAQRNPNVLAKTAVKWIQSQMKKANDAFHWVRFSKIVSTMHILEGWPDQAHNKMKALLRAIANDGLLEENVGASPLCFRVTGKYYAMPEDKLEKYIIDNHVPSKSPWRPEAHFKDSSNKKVDVPAWMDSSTFHEKIIAKKALPAVEVYKKKQDPVVPVPDLTPEEITSANMAVQERIGFQVPTQASDQMPYSKQESTRGSIRGKNMAVDVSQMKAEIEGIVHAAMLNEFSDEGAMIEKRLHEQIQTFVDGIEKKVIEQIGKSGKIPVIHRIEFNDEALLRMKVRGHTMLKKAVQAAAAGCNVLLIGPDGCGKSTMAKHMAKLLKCEGVLITTFPDLVSSYLADNSLTCFQNIHRYDQRALTKCKQIIDSNPKAKFVATMLRGEELPSELAPVFPLAKITMEFDKDIESQICPDSELLLRFWRWREAATTRRFSPIFSTRAIQEAYRLITGAGWTLEEIRDLATADWTLHERSVLTLE